LPKIGPKVAVLSTGGTTIGYAKFYSRSHDAGIRVYDEAGNVIETHEHAGDFTSSGCANPILPLNLRMVCESQDAQDNRLTRNSPSETIAPRNRSLAIDRHADQFG